MDAPWRWLKKGWADYKRAPVLSAGYGLLFTGVGYLIIFGLIRTGLLAAAPVAIGAFALVGPLMAAGLYALARALGEGRRPGAGEVIFVRAAAPTQVAYLGVLLLVGLFAWTICAAALFAMFGAGGPIIEGRFAEFALGTSQGLAMITIGTIVGGAIAFAIFAATAFSIPMLIDRDVDFITAIGTSFTAVKGSPRAMVLWAWIISLCIAIGAATLLFGFIVIFPLLGLATWHAYREVFAPSSS